MTCEQEKLPTLKISLETFKNSFLLKEKHDIHHILTVSSLVGDLILGYAIVPRLWLCSGVARGCLAQCRRAHNDAALHTQQVHDSNGAC